MRARKLLVGVGIAVTTFLLVNAAGLELLPAVVDEPFDAATLAFVLGVLAGLAAGGLVTFRTATLSRVVRASLVAYAVFGVVLVVLWALAVTDAAGVASTVSLPLQLGLSLAAAVVAAFLVLRRRRVRPVASA